MSAIADAPEDIDSLDELRLRLAGAISRHAAFDGWTAHAVASAADELGVDRDVAHLALDGRPAELIEAWIEAVDHEMADRFGPGELAAMKVRDRIVALVMARLEIATPDREALRRALAIMAMPQNAARTTRTAWRSADRMWRLAGDDATDFNHYSKRALLASIYAATLLAFLDDESDGLADTRAFLERRVDEVMRFGKFTGQLFGRSRERPSLARFLGRLRYPAR